MTHAPKPDTSNIVVSVGGTAVYNNVNQGTDMSDTDGDGTVDFIDKWFPLHKYSGGKVYLEAGVNVVEFTLGRTFDNAFKFAIDYVKVTKSQDSIDVSETGYVTITAKYAEPVTGNLYMAFYQGGKLVSAVPAGSANNQTEVVGEEQGPADKYDYVKMFVWDTGNNLIPDAQAIGFAQ